jgi:hypothetical protein
MQRKIMNDKLLYRIPEVAEHLSISRSKVYASAARPQRSSDIQFSLKVRIRTQADFGGQAQIVVKMVVRSIAKLSETLIRSGWCIAVA